MILVLNEIIKAISNDHKNDDSFELWCGSKHKEKHLASPSAFYSRHGIMKGDEYLYISFVDTDTGELLFINCLEKIHNAMCRYKIYPQFILNGLNIKQ